MKIIFICHNDESIQSVFHWLSDDSVYIIFVGDNPITIQHSKILIANTYPNHIEQHKKLLTFTAWYLIVNNDLFKDEDSLCIFEYDVTFEPSLIQKIKENYNNYDLISFQERSDLFEADIDIECMKEYLTQQGLPYMTTWWPTTNHCIKRDLLCDFVNFYYYTYTDISDNIQLSFYHERVFSSYTHTNSRLILDGVTHQGKNSHKGMRFKKYATFYDVSFSYQMTLSLNDYSDIEVLRYEQSNLPQDFLNDQLWKPYMVYDVLSNLPSKSSLMYIDSSIYFTESFDSLYDSLNLFKIWKHPYYYVKESDIEYIIQLYGFNDQIKSPVSLVWTDLMILENSPYTIQILRQWLNICIDFKQKIITNQVNHNIPYVDIIFSILINIYQLHCPYFYFNGIRKVL